MDRMSRTTIRGSATFVATPDTTVKVKVVPRAFVMAYTPTMMMARRAAIEEWGMPEDTRLDEFIDAVLDKFFEDRGIKLGGYIVMSRRIDPNAVHQARVAAVGAKKTLGQWLEEAIAEKIEREKGQDTQ